MMRLRELNARFVAAEGRDGMGMVFDCPHCLPRSEPFALYFANPLDGGAALAPEAGSKNHRWARTGNSVDDLTLSPSVNCLVGEQGQPGFEQHWHGWILNGEIR